MIETVVNVIIFLIPGITWTYTLFSKEIDLLERFALSVALSVALIPLVIYLAYNFFSLQINYKNFIYINIILSIIAFTLFYFKNKLIYKIRMK